MHTEKIPHSFGMTDDSFGMTDDRHRDTRFR